MFTTFNTIFNLRGQLHLSKPLRRAITERQPYSLGLCPWDQQEYSQLLDSDDMH